MLTRWYNKPIIMTILLYILCIISIVALVLVAAVQINRADVSRFELRRRVKAGDVSSKTLLEREEIVHDIVSLQRALQAVLLVCMAVLAIAACGWLVGILLAVVVALEFGVVARWSVVATPVQHWYQAYEPRLVAFVQQHPKLFRLIRSITRSDDHDVRLHSREELFHVVHASGDILTTDERRLVEHSLLFGERVVREHMTPADKIVSVPKAEVLGPLVLDDLHKTGLSRFPVVGDGLSDIIGILHIRDLLTVKSGSSTTTAEQAMEPRVYYVHESQPLSQALAAFIKSRHHLFVVVNDEQETVGLISLEDVMEALLGRAIEDEFDAHENPRAVAARAKRPSGT